MSECKGVIAVCTAARIAAALALVIAAAPAPAQMFDKTNPQREIELGRQAAREVERMYPPTTNRANQERVQRIGRALVENLPEKAYPYEFKVLAVPEFNAFCLPGGFMYVFDGLLTRLPSDHALAFVMAHEMAHASHRHWAKHIDKMKGATILAILAGAATGAGDLVTFIHTLISAGYTRDQEDDADRTGLQYAWLAGFEPSGAADAAVIMVQMEHGSSVPTYLRDHPPAKDRLKRLQAQSAELKGRQRPAPKMPAVPVEMDPAQLVGKLPESALAPNDWFPLAVGNEWRYRVTGGTATSNYTLKIASRIQLPAGDVYRAETLLAGGVVPCQMLTTADAAWRRNRPAAMDSKWQVETLLLTEPNAPRDTGGWTYTPLKAEPLTTPCGTFADTLHLRRSNGRSTYELWFARGVGMVKRTCAETGVIEVLMNYTKGR